MECPKLYTELTAYIKALAEPLPDPRDKAAVREFDHRIAKAFRDQTAKRFP